MRDWKAHHRILYLKRIIENEAYPLSSCCNQCAKADSLYRCDECSGQALWCKECCLEKHQTSPFHHPKKWNGRFFKPLDLDKMGLTLFFGHGGKPCPTLSQHTDPGPSHIDEDGDIVMEDPDPNADGWEDEVQTGFIGDRLRLVHTTGIFSRRVRWCGCMGKDGLVMPQDMQLLEAQFYPATSDRPSTAFTFNVLDEFAIDTLECKTAALSFLSKLRRLTNPVFPLSTPMLPPVAQFDCFETCWSITYSESREPGKNVSIDEVKASSDPKLYRPQIVVDGNFKLDNLKMRNPGDDVRLSDGEMFCVGSIQYDEHVRITPERKQRSNCNNHRAVNDTNVKRKEVDSTGIGACACARHGCFYPHSVVGFKLGEKQVNIDYAISEVFRQIPPEIKQILLMYDVCCQWVIYWMKRFMEGEYLFYREDLELFPAVGKFHLGAHILECFWEFSLNFMEGSGQVDGEILETLWASLDKVAGSTRSMSRAHRQEVLDGYMNDSNWKKMVGSVRALIAKMDRAEEGFESLNEAFEQLSLRVGDDVIAKWEQEEQDAFAPGGQGRKIYKAGAAENPGVTEMCLRLTEKERKETGVLSGSIALITEGLNIEQAQNNLAIYIRSLGKRPTAAQKRDTILKQDGLQKRITKFHKSMVSFIHKHESDSDTEELEPSDDEDSENGDHTYDSTTMVDDLDSGDEDDTWDDDNNQDDSDTGTTASVETMRLSLPSNMKQGRLSNDMYRSLQIQEATLREGQINQSLEKLRLALGDKAWMLRNNVRDASGGKGKLRAWSGVKKKDQEVRKHWKLYTQACNALHRMGMGKKWKPITKDDLKMSGDMTEANRTGQRASTLPWFWRLEDGGAAEEMENNAQMSEFYRVNWLRAKARVMRWTEEKKIVSNEMVWTINSFKYYQEQWQQRVEDAGLREPGLRAYAEKQVDLWKSFAVNGEKYNAWSAVPGSKAVIILPPPRPEVSLPKAMQRRHI
ncbi:hypothetical protein B0H11DRAFT_2199920 [Mycena galericulata]|nr:hypothetical protein B0H11DRAFT_2199920 [Mycena galericulata]